MDRIDKDLRDRCGEVRDQGPRPTCLAFATSDTHAVVRSPWSALSCEFIFYHAQRRGGRLPTQGATLSFMLEALKEDGQPIESAWPYLTRLPADLAKWVPPSTPLELYRRGNTVNTSAVDEVIRLLDMDTPSLMVMMLSDAFYKPNADGIVNAPPGEQPDPTRLHAVVAIGHGMHASDRHILVRNSWGTGWGMKGYAWLPERFLNYRLRKVVALTEEINVPSSALAA